MPGGAALMPAPAMTTLLDRPNTALLVIDVREGVVRAAQDRDAVVANIRRLVDLARESRVPVVWVQHDDPQLSMGSAEWRIVAEMQPREGERLIQKTYGDAFEATPLENVLEGLRVGRVVVTGAQTDACIRSTIHGAFVRGYDVDLVGDAHTTDDHTAYGAPPPGQVIAHTNLYWRFQTAPGRLARTLTAANVDFAAPRRGKPKNAHRWL